MLACLRSASVRSVFTAVPPRRTRSVLRPCRARREIVRPKWGPGEIQGHAGKLVGETCPIMKRTVRTVYHFNRVIAPETGDLHPVLVQCWATVADGGPALNQHRVMVSSFLPSHASVCDSITMTPALTLNCWLPRLKRTYVSVRAAPPGLTLPWISMRRQQIGVGSRCRCVCCGSKMMRAKGFLPYARSWLQFWWLHYYRNYNSAMQRQNQKAVSAHL